MMLDWLGPMDKALLPPLPLDDDGEREEDEGGAETGNFAEETPEAGLGKFT